MTQDDYLKAIQATAAEVERFLVKRDETGRQPNRGWTYDAELGWVHADARHIGDGVDGSHTSYHYAEDGARLPIHDAGYPSRIHTFGDSYTHGDQVNDGETWQEYLAAHLGEPIRNYGVGGYSVYQAYRRMLKVRRETSAHATHVLLNIYEDDHFRNLDSYRALRHGRRSNCGFTLPHVRVRPDEDIFEERENLITQPEGVYQLCDLDYLRHTFAEDPIARLALRLRNLAPAESATSLDPVPVYVGIAGSDADNAEARALWQGYVRDALYASQRIVERVEAFCRAENLRLFVILSFSEGTMAKALRGEAIWDQPFAAWVKQRGYPVFDLRDAFAAVLAESRLDVSAFLRRYYNGHLSPAGNFFLAWAVKGTLVSWLDPPPAPYRR